MILYNGQFEDGGGDFVCFGLKEGYPEFRFDVGSGPAIIRGNNTLPLNEWHTIKLTRDRQKGKNDLLNINIYIYICVVYIKSVLKGISFRYQRYL